MGDRNKPDGVDKTFANPLTDGAPIDVGTGFTDQPNYTGTLPCPTDQAIPTEPTEIPLQPLLQKANQKQKQFVHQYAPELWEELKTNKKVIILDVPPRTGKTTLLFYHSNHALDKKIFNRIFYAVPSYDQIRKDYLTKWTKGKIALVLKGKNKYCVSGKENCKGCKVLHSFSSKRFNERLDKLMGKVEQTVKKGETYIIDKEDFVEAGVCPYFGAISLLTKANIILTHPQMLEELFERFRPKIESSLHPRSLLIFDEADRIIEETNGKAIPLIIIRGVPGAFWKNIEIEEYAKTLQALDLIEKATKEIYPESKLLRIIERIRNFVNIINIAVRSQLKVLCQRLVLKLLSQQPLSYDTLHQKLSSILVEDFDDALAELKEGGLVFEKEGKLHIDAHKYALSPFGLLSQAGIKGILKHGLATISKQIDKEVKKLDNFIKENCTPEVEAETLDVAELIRYHNTNYGIKAKARDILLALFMYRDIYINKPSDPPLTTEVYLRAKHWIDIRYIQPFDKVIYSSGTLRDEHKRLIDIFHCTEGVETLGQKGYLVDPSDIVLVVPDKSDVLELVLATPGYRKLWVHRSYKIAEFFREKAGGKVIRTKTDIDPDTEILHIVEGTRTSENVEIEEIDFAVIDPAYKTKEIEHYGSPSYDEKCADKAFQAFLRGKTGNKDKYVIVIPRSLYLLRQDRIPPESVVEVSSIEEAIRWIKNKLPAPVRTPAEEIVTVTSRKQSPLGELRYECRLSLTKEASAVIDCLLRREEVSRTELCRRMQKKGVNAETIREILDELKSKGLVEIRKERTGKRGPPKEIIRTRFTSKEELANRLSRSL